MELLNAVINNIEPLQIYEEPIEKQNILVSQINQGNIFEIFKGDITENFGTNLLFNINGTYENIAIGTPVISLSVTGCLFGKVIGIKVDNFLSGEENDKFAAHNINIFLESIKSLVYSQKISPEETLSEPKKLSLKEKRKLKDKGLKEIDNNNDIIFESPASQGITSLFFYRTHYAWFWTPTELKEFSKEKILKCNWSLIKQNLKIIAIGGKYDKVEPAPRNVTLIEYLISTNLDFLLD